ncbi:ABC transporter substrate-binding protein [Modestobacter sp. KNN46-3]|uniref:ABC transporter substrate-binding protein n=1 Tax=Modestobacter sp. KNN46-3 TaxID=2711218 RepID=UPI0013E07A08|nr:iron-siderophore ABC transporter substrate-binding protein [Modestobacter sp. KNN46-3]
MRLRLLTTAVVTAMALSACGSDAEEPSATADQESDGPATRSVTHVLGTTEVPVDPQRVVTLDTPHLDTALALDITPVGSVHSDVATGFPEYLGERTEGIEPVGTIEEPNLESIAALEPDLILSSSVRHEDIYDELSQIAPTVFTDYTDGWRSMFTTTADALNMAEAGTDALAGYDARVDEVGAAVGAEGATASIVRFLPEETRVYGPETFSGSLLADVGFTLPQLEYDEYSMAYVSAELIDQADADIVFSTTYGDPAATTKDGITAVWDFLEAVPDCAFEVADDEWMLGIGLIGAEVVLEDIESTLNGSDCL